MSQLTRRRFLQLSGAAAGAASAGLGFDVAQAVDVKMNLRISGAREAKSVCPYCAVGCSLIAYTNAERTKVLQIEGDPQSPVNEGRLCPKGATAMQLATARRRVEAPLYRAPGATTWQKISWNDALDKIAQRIKDSRDRTFVGTDANGNTVNRTEGIAFAGGAAFSTEEGYFATKVMRTLGLVHLEQQARV